MDIRDRVRELRRVRASDLRPHPRNWRTHPPAQQDVLRGVLAEIGYAAALLVTELPDGSLQIIDGHLRAETTPAALVPVLVLDLDPQEAELLLATHDPLAALAGADRERLEALAREIKTQNEAVRAMLAELSEQAGQSPTSEAAAPLSSRDPSDLPDVEIAESYQVIVECRDEADQQAVYERMSGEGYRCRVLTL